MKSTCTVFSFSAVAVLAVCYWWCLAARVRRRVVGRRRHKSAVRARQLTAEGYLERFIACTKTKSASCKWLPCASASRFSS
jgi:hypothetical protein